MRQRPLDTRHQQLGGLGGQHAARMPVEQAYAQLLLQTRHCLSQRWLRQIHLRRSRVDAPGLVYHGQRVEVTQIRFGSRLHALTIIKTNMHSSN